MNTNQNILFYLGQFWNGCSASNNQYGYNCLEAIDGITNIFDNGWAYSGGAGGGWAIFELAEERTMNTLVIFNGQGHGIFRLIIFRVFLKVSGLWMDLTGLKVQEDPSAQIGENGNVTLASGIEVLHLEFNTVTNVQSVRLEVTKTDHSNNNVVLNEIIPKFEHREVKL